MNSFMSPAAPRAMILSPNGFPPHPEFDGRAAATPAGRLGNVLRRRWLPILCCALVAAILAGALGLRMPRLYTAWAQVVITPQAAPARVGLPDRVGEEAAMTIETQVSVLQSRDLMSRVLARLVGSPRFPILDFAREGTGHRIARWLAGDIGRITAGTWVEAAMGPDWEAGLHAFAVPPNPRQWREMVIDELMRSLKVNSEPRSRVVSVRYTAKSPDLAAMITNTVIETYIDAQKSSKREDIRLELARLEKRLPNLHAELQAASAQIRAYRLDHAVPDANSTDLQEQQAVALKGAIKAADAELAQATANAPGEVATLLGRKQALEKQLDAMQARLGETQPAADHLKELLRLLEAKRQVYEDGLLEQQKLLQSQDLVTADAAVLSAAAPPQKPASTSPILFLPPALVAGLLIGGLVAIWREFADDALRSERAIPQELGIPCAGFLPARPGRTPPAGSAAAAPSDALRAAALRFIATATLNPAAREGFRSILVTSSVSGEGSAALAEELALQASRLAARVLLVDLQPGGGAPAPQPATAVKAEPKAGAGVPVLASPVPGMVLTQPAKGSELHVLRAEDQAADLPALPLGRDLPQTFKRLRDSYDCVIVHAGPVLEATGARLLAGEVDQVLLAIRWGRTPRAVVENALAVLCRIESAAGKPSGLSAVLTDVDVRRHLSYRFGDAVEALVRAHRRRGFGLQAAAGRSLLRG